MKLVLNFDVTQIVNETWEIEVSDDINIKDYLEAVEMDSNIIFEHDGHPNQIGDAHMTDSETYDTLSMKLVSVGVRDNG